ncbi:arsenite methyltransferase [Candidatus Nitrosotenuis sp. DW1]|uniref:arsenite methyltransferase n=1 Tax=Candidatus Nitrosotenuis sp. DW1 TaxID=2259672 RepID=UPI0015C8FC79|nr:arsenite methyltransferase [Candidatus Nitrosotenuis sp. DW1]QLH09617.1 protein-L-isoaspartate(D-aspartate) O-methyltransferase [Candidatus Nitrosotenuis sp. DW1]
MTTEIKNEIKQRYGKIALSGNSNCCCMPGECGTGTSPIESAGLIGYDAKDLESIPQSAILGVGCGAPIKLADLKEGEVIVDIGSGAGIDAFLAANVVGKSGKVIGIDMTDEMLEKARKNAKDGKYDNVEFKKGDVEDDIPLPRYSADAVISNCVINLTIDKTKAFKEIYRILKKGGRMIISDLITSKELQMHETNSEQWCACIDGALTKENYLDAINNAGFKNISVLDERIYMEDNARKITSLVIKALKE